MLILLHQTYPREYRGLPAGSEKYSKMTYLFILTYVLGGLEWYHRIKSDAHLLTVGAQFLLILLSIFWVPVTVIDMMWRTYKVVWQLIRNLWWTARHDDKMKNLKEAWRIFLTLRTNRYDYPRDEIS